MGDKTGLNEQLEQYTLTAKGQIARSRTVGEIAGYAAAVGAGLAMAGNAEAGIIYSGVQNISVEINPAFQTTASSFSFFQSQFQAINLDSSVNNTDDVGLGILFSGSGSQNAAKYYGVAGLFALNAAFRGTGSSSYGVFFFGASNLTASSGVVGPNGPPFNVGNAGQRKIQAISGESVSTVKHLGRFTSSTTGIVGIRLTSGSYGWIRLKLEDLGRNHPFGNSSGGQGYVDKVTVIDWAYEKDPGVAIHVGDKGPTIPEPSSLALLAAGAAGLATFRRRKARQAQSC